MKSAREKWSKIMSKLPHRIIQNLGHVPELVQRDHGVAVDDAPGVRVAGFDHRALLGQPSAVVHGGVAVYPVLCR